MSGAFPGRRFVLLGHSGAYTDMLCVSSAPTPFPPHPVLELPPLSPLCLSSQAWSIRPFSVLEFQSLPLTGPFSAYKRSPCSLTNLHKLRRWRVNSLLYTRYGFFFWQFVSILVVISKSFKFSLDFIWKVASIKRWHTCCFILILWSKFVTFRLLIFSGILGCELCPRDLTNFCQIADLFSNHLLL